MDKLAMMAALARQANMTYGKWMAKHGGDPMPPVVEPTGPICPQCGKEFEIPKAKGRKRRFCSDECTKIWHKIVYVERRRNNNVKHRKG